MSLDAELVSEFQRRVDRYILRPLPSGLEYRIVDTHLVLIDLDADIVVDYMLDVMCRVC